MEQSTVSQDPFDYAKYIVYVKRGVPCCETLREKCLAQHDVLLQDVSQLQTSKPQWLVGVPTVVELPSYKVYAGSDAIDLITRHCDTAIVGVSAAFGSQQTAGTGIGATLGTMDSTDYNMPVAAELDSVPLARDPRYEESAPETLNKYSLEEMMRKRG